MLGSVTEKKVRHPDAPSEVAASSRSRPCACISGTSSRATKGAVTNIEASTMPGSANRILMSAASSTGPNRPCRP